MGGGNPNQHNHTVETDEGDSVNVNDNCNGKPKNTNKYKNNNKNKNNEQIKCTFWNCRGLHLKQDVLVDTALRYKWDIVGLCEVKQVNQSLLTCGVGDRYTWNVGVLNDNNNDVYNEHNTDSSSDSDGGGDGDGQAHDDHDTIVVGKRQSTGIWVGGSGLAFLISKNIVGAVSTICDTPSQLWIKVLGKTKKHVAMFIGVVYIPAGNQKLSRSEIYNELAINILKYSELGMVIVGGDFNGRIACNGDTVTNIAGTDMIELCYKCHMNIINIDITKCNDLYTRVASYGSKLHQTTIDYVLVNDAHDDRIDKLVFDSKQMGSDHKPLVTYINYHLNKAAHVANDQTKHIAWQLDSMTLDKWASYASISDQHMQTWFEYVTQQHMVVYEDDDDDDDDDDDNKRVSSTMSVDAMVATFVLHMISGAVQGIGAKYVSRKSKPFITATLRDMIQTRNMLMDRCVKLARNHHADKQQLRIAVYDHIGISRQVVTYIKKAKRHIQQNKWLQIESTNVQKVFWKRVKLLAGRHSTVPDSLMVYGQPVSDIKGKTIAMMNYYKQLGQEHIHSIHSTTPAAHTTEQVQAGDSVNSNSNNNSKDNHENDDDSITKTVANITDCTSSSGFDECFRQTVVGRVKHLLSISQHQNNAIGSMLNTPFVLDEVVHALATISNGKAAGHDHIVYEMIKYGGECTHKATLLLFETIWKTEQWPTNWQCGMIFNIFKSGDKQLMDDYRGITLLCALSKLFEVILSNRLMAWSESHNILHDEQGGFRTNRGCDHQQFILHEILSSRWYKHNKTKREATYACFIDVKKAYDRVWRTGLWSILHDLGVHGKIWRMLTAMYSNVKRRVLCGNNISDEFIIECGVPQGSVLSPWLYDCYINGLATQLKLQEYGISIAGRKVPLLCYADDIVLLSASIVNMKHMLASISQYAIKWRFTYNINKSNLLVYGSKKHKDVAKLHTFLLGGQAIAIVDEYRYLGIEFGKHNTAGKYNTMLDRLLLKTKKQIGLIISMGCTKNSFMPTTCVTLWKSLILPLFEYGTQLWYCSQNKMNKMESMQCSFGRRVLGMHPTTPNVFIRLELGLLPIQSRKDILILKWWGRLWSITDKNRLVYVIMLYRWNQMKVNDGMNSISSTSVAASDYIAYDTHSSLIQVRDTLIKYDLLQYWLHGPLVGTSTNQQLLTLQKWYTLVYKTVWLVTAKNERERVQQLSSLSTYEHLLDTNSHAYVNKIASGHDTISSSTSVSSKPRIAEYLKNTYNRDGTIIKAKLRANTLPIYDVIGSRENPKWTDMQKSCPVCKSNHHKENVQHFIAECTAYNDIRSNMFKHMNDKLLAMCSYSDSDREGHEDDRTCLRLLISELVEQCKCSPALLVHVILGGYHPSYTAIHNAAHVCCGRNCHTHIHTHTNKDTDSDTAMCTARRNDRYYTTTYSIINSIANNYLLLIYKSRQLITISGSPK
jgi:hypothetical protein